jgi:hypothetical protein
VRRIWLVLIVAGLSAASAQKGTRVSENFSTPMSDSIANDCTGEEVKLSGEVHTQYSARETAEGFRAESGTNYEGVSGVGVNSGRKYRLVGSDRSVTDFRRPFPSRSTVIQTVRIISQGGAPDAHYRVQWHYTIDANGRLTADVFKTEIECRGR